MKLNHFPDSEQTITLTSHNVELGTESIELVEQEVADDVFDNSTETTNENCGNYFRS